MFIRAFGIYHELADTHAALAETLTQHPALPDDKTSPLRDPRLCDRNLVSREDRSVLNDVTVMALNSMHDLMRREGVLAEHGVSLKDALGDAMIITACDGPDVSCELDNTLKIYRSCEDREAVWKNIDQIGRIANPLDVLRLLTTNALYHISKLVGSHNEGYPIQTASISSLTAIDMANAYLGCTSEATDCIVSAASNMNNIEFLAYWLKIDKLWNRQNGDGIVPMWGAGSLLISEESAGSLAEIVATRLIYQPKAAFDRQDWCALMDTLSQSGIRPDVMVSYHNGVKQQGDDELAAIDQYFPGVPIKNYKQYIGYSGKSNTVLDAVCVLSDDSIPDGSLVCINAAGLNYGLGYLVLRKNRS